MTIADKYNKLSEMCDEIDNCADCLIHRKFPKHKCGNGYSYHCERAALDKLVPEKEVERIYSWLEDFGKFKQEEQSEEINHPDRYNDNGYECIEVMQAVFGLEAVKAFCKLNAFKYIWRADKKGHTEDLKKAVFYLNRYIKLEEEENEKQSSE